MISRVRALLRRAEILHQSETVGPIRVLKLDNVHAFLNEMQPQTSRLDVIQLAPAEFALVYSRAAIAEQDFQSSGNLVTGLPLNRVEEYLDGLVQPAAVCVADNIRQSLVDGASDRPAFLAGKAERFRQSFHGAAHGTEQFGVALHLQPEQQALYRAAAR